MLFLFAVPCRMLGYNTVRLPFRYMDLDQYVPQSYVSARAFTVAKPCACWAVRLMLVCRHPAEPPVLAHVPGRPAQAADGARHLD
jgi:hypothetical protein